MLLVHPPLLPETPVSPPLGLCVLASALMEAKHEVEILDLDLELKIAGQRASGEQLLGKALARLHPDAVGFTSMYSNSLQAERLIARARREYPSVPILAGGPHFGALGSQSLRRIPELDYVLQGEAEPGLIALLDVLDNGGKLTEVPALCYRSNGIIHETSPAKLLDLTKVAPVFPRLGESLSLGRYAATIPEEWERRFIYIEAGRGCPYACTFCATAPFWNRRYRVKSIPQIVEEISFLYDDYGYDSFNLVHDLLTLDQEFLFEFCDAMLAAKLPVEWMANSRTDISLRGLLPKMRASGCWKLFFGVESASPRIQKDIHKNLKPKQVLSTITELSDNGITATCSFVVGLPKESRSELSASIGLAARLKVMGVETVQVHRVRLWPPSPLALEQLPKEFDEEALKIEYPFLDVPKEDIDAISADPDFFSGYFAPKTAAGSRDQIAQVEIFFHHTIALVPLSICLLARLLGDDLISSFYAALHTHGSLRREHFEWGTSVIAKNWLGVSGLLKAWMRDLGRLDDWERELVCGLLSYEEQRLKVLSGEFADEDFIIGSGPDWKALRCTVEVDRLLECLVSEQPLKPRLLKEILIVLVRRASSWQAYTGEIEQLAQLQNAA
jgi:radical SAM superfamily enzyme YgiQ (UPF0313 family)